MNKNKINNTSGYFSKLGFFKSPFLKTFLNLFLLNACLKSINRFNFSYFRYFNMSLFIVHQSSVQFNKRTLSAGRNNILYWKKVSHTTPLLGNSNIYEKFVISTMLNDNF